MMKLVELLHQLSASRELQFLLIGGHAVNAWGYSRNTHDIDLLVRRTQKDQWKGDLEPLGYSLTREENAFVHFDGTAEAVWPLDLMLVSDETFSKMYAAAKQVSISNVPVYVPSVPHLIALKLHVLKQNLPHRTIKDFCDVQGLIDCNRIDLNSSEMREIFEKYGTADLYRRVKVACEQ